MGKSIKFIILIVISFIIFSSAAFAQFKFIGGSFGLNLSKLNYKDDLQGYNFNYRNGIKLGLFTEYNLADLFLIHTEINYSMRGTEYGLDEIESFGLTIPKHKFIQKINYVEVPVLFEYNLPINFYLKPKIFIGPEISFLLNAKIEYIEDDVSKNEIEEKDTFKSTEYGIVMGVGTDYNIFLGKFIFDVRYYYGLSNINKVEGSKITSNTLSFNLGYAFSLL
jgi:hypothetical protein